MSFQLLKETVIDKGLCTYCGLCSRNCKHIQEVISPKKAEKEGTKAQLPKVKKKRCMMERGALQCGLCYNSCPIVRKLGVIGKRTLILNTIKENGPVTIPQLEGVLGQPASTLRYDVLRLVQEREIHMNVGADEPIFS